MMPHLPPPNSNGLDKNTNISADCIGESSQKILIESALKYAEDFRLSVIPVKKDKSPTVIWKPYVEKIMTSDEITRLFNKQSVHGLALVCGKGSGNLEVIDVDCKNDDSGTLWDDYSSEMMEYRPETYKKLTIAKTVNEGYHLYFRSGSVGRNQELAKRENKKVLIETRGEGGYIVVPPTTGYSFIQGEFSSIPEISEEERNFLLSLARSFDRSGLYAESRTLFQSNDDVIGSFDDFNARGDVEVLLQKHGWQKTRENEISVFFKRPGETNNPIGGSLLKESKLFYVFTTSTNFQAGKAYNPSQVYAELECNGDLSEASNKLYDEGFGNRVGFKTEKTESKQAKTPTPLLPIDGFPQKIQDFILTCVEVYQSPRDFWAGSVILSTALAIGNKMILNYKYQNAPVLWMCLVGDVSSGKTTPLDVCFKYFFDKDTKAFCQYNNERVDEEKADKSKKSLKSDPMQYALVDYTPEALASIHSVNHRGVIILRDELDGWLNDFNRYNKSGEQSNMLSSFNGYPWRSNRKGSQTIDIPNPCIFVGGGMQPELLPNLAKDNRSESGFLARMCFVFPDSRPKPNLSKKSMPEKEIIEFKDFLERLIIIPDKITLKLSSEANEAYEAFYNENAQLINSARNDYLKGMLGKLDIICLRIAIIVQGMHWCYSENHSPEISGSEMKSAIAITDYFRHTGYKVHDKIFGAKSFQNKQAIAAKYLIALEHSKSVVAELLKTSRSQIDRIIKDGT